jgi:hypothetical protein
MSKKFLTVGLIAATAAIALPAFADSHYDAEFHQGHTVGTRQSALGLSNTRLDLAQVGASATEKSAARSLDGIREISPRSVSLVLPDEIASLYSRN